MDIILDIYSLWRRFKKKNHLLHGDGINEALGKSLNNNNKNLKSSSKQSNMFLLKHRKEKADRY